MVVGAELKGGGKRNILVVTKAVLYLKGEKCNLLGVQYRWWLELYLKGKEMRPTACTKNDEGCTRKEREMRLNGCIEGGRSCTKKGRKATNWYTKSDRTLDLKETKNGMS